MGAPDRRNPSNDDIKQLTLGSPSIFLPLLAENLNPEGDYDVEIPFDTPSGMYSIRVGVFDDDTVFGCSDEFEVVSEDDEEEGGGISMSFRF